jgi:GTP-binding protein
MQIRDAQFLSAATAPEQLPAPAFVEIAFAGRSNVGKSSLINSLLERKKLVRTSSTPGCTRGINLFRIGLVEPEATLDFVDLPGYGYAKRSKVERRSWGPLIEGFLENRPGLRGVVVIVDARRGFEPDDLELIAFLEALGRTPILVGTKLDKLPSSKANLRAKELSRTVEHPVHVYSSSTGAGRDRLWKTILKVAAIGATSEPAKG